MMRKKTRTTTYGMSAKPRKQAIMFLFMGGLSTLVMWGIYLLLNQFLKFQVAYLIAYAITVVVSYLLNSWFVFHTPLSLQTFFQFPLIYVVQYFGSAILLGVLVRAGLPETCAPLVAIFLLLPVTFWLSRVIMVKK